MERIRRRGIKGPQSHGTTAETHPRVHGVPPLHKRPSDISLLAFHFLEKFNGSMGKSLRGISSESVRLLEAYSWPGNVRELENAVERAVALEKGSEITPDSLPERVVHG